MTIKKYPASLTEGQLKAVADSGKTPYAIAKESNTRYATMFTAIVKNRPVQLGTIATIARTLGMSIDEFESL